MRGQPPKSSKGSPRVPAKPCGPSKSWPWGPSFSTRSLGSFSQLRGQNPADIPGTHGKTQRNPQRNLEPARIPPESSRGPFRDPAKPLRGLPEAGQGTRHFWQEALTHLHICMAGAQRNPPEPAAEPASKMRRRRSHRHFLIPTTHPEPAGTRFGTRAFCKTPNAICQFFASTP